MFDKVVNGLVAAVFAVFTFAIVAVLFGADTSLITNLTTAAVDIIVRVGVLAIIGTVFYTLGKGLLKSVGA
ncbi:hypothetical protein ACFQPA_09825 [Halomarina halobia]|uniref:Uncharacterized protein n=1 Tax=Halomarina halobia TaxID=3033386 RepID=A0ABD6ABR6_9EURY|nr:hypothetical protein [Halomarina sp. PSR21]